MFLTEEDTAMGRKRHTAEEIVSKLRQVDVLTAQGHAVADAIRTIGVTEVTYYRWRNEYGGGGHPEIDRIAIETTVGMVFSNAIAFFIILTTAAVLNAGGITNIQSAAQAAGALRPLAGDLTFFLFALGIIGTGLLAIPVLAGSAAYGVAEAFGWPATLEARAPDAVGFYGIIAAATIIGFGLGFTSIDPIKMLIWSAVLNGIVAVPIMAVMMVIVSKVHLMGRFKGNPWLLGFGWGGTVLMAVAVIAFIWSLLS
jgi:Mn2+/Fe2+ NRAMP family transporter